MPEWRNKETEHSAKRSGTRAGGGRREETKEEEERDRPLSLTKEQIAAIVDEYKRGENDTGSAEVQIALLNARIKYLTEHFKTHKHDHTSRRGLYKLVGKQRRLLRYLYRTDIERYRALIAKLGLRDRFSARAS